MKTEKKWEKTQEMEYEFFINEEKKGTISINFASSSQKAIASWENKTFQIERIGFWKNSIQIVNANKQVILQVEPEKWYSNNWSIDFEGEKYRLIVRNNPLVEFTILKNNQEQITYSLCSDSATVYTKITDHSHTPIIFDFLLWYIFLPISQENGDSTFFILTL